MSLSATGTRRPLQSRPKQNPFLKRSGSSFGKYARTKPSTEPVAKRVKTHDDGDNDDDPPLQHRGIVTSLPPKGVPQDVLSLVNYILENMFEPIPESRSGMNSTRIAQALNYRKNLAPIVSLAHLHAISKSSTATDRELATLVSRGVIRRISVLGRGRGGAPIGEGIILISSWISLVRSSSLPPDLQTKYLDHLTTLPALPTLTDTTFTPTETSLLLTHGFLTSTSALSTPLSAPISRAPAFTTLGTEPVSAAISASPSGSHAAVGGVDALHLHGGVGGGLPSQTSSSSGRSTLIDQASRGGGGGGGLTFSVPGTGAYLQLLSTARARLVELTTRSSPRHGEVVADLLAEKWDGDAQATDARAVAKRARGEWTGSLPGRTVKWKSFWGLKYRWVLEEAFGGGVVEGFETGSVGLGVRVVR